MKAGQWLTSGCIDTFIRAAIPRTGDASVLYLPQSFIHSKLLPLLPASKKSKKQTENNDSNDNDNVNATDDNIPLDPWEQVLNAKSSGARVALPRFFSE